MDGPRGEQIVNCPFCDNALHEPMHFITGRQVFERPDQISVLLSFTCTYGLRQEPPSDLRDLWPWTFFLLGQVVEKRRRGATEGGVDAPPGIKLTPEEQTFFRSLGDRLEDEEEGGP